MTTFLSDMLKLLSSLLRHAAQFMALKGGLGALTGVLSTMGCWMVQGCPG